MAIAMQDAHRCIERSTDCDCPICGEYMFTSLRTVVCMLCGHSIHRRCYEEHIKTSYRCPICSRSIANMEWQFTRLRRAIELQPMPEEFRDTKAWVYCNDCVAKTVVKYHWLGLQCGVYVPPLFSSHCLDQRLIDLIHSDVILTILFNSPSLPLPPPYHQQPLHLPHYLPPSKPLSILCARAPEVAFATIHYPTYSLELQRPFPIQILYAIPSPLLLHSLRSDETPIRFHRPQ